MIVFFYGQDSYRSKKSLNDLKINYQKTLDPNGDNIVYIDGEKINEKDFRDNIRNNSLFSNKRLIIVNSLFKNKKNTIFNIILDILRELEKNNDNTLVFYEDNEVPEKKHYKELLDYLKKQEYSQEFKKLSEKGKLIFIKKELDKYNKKITNSAANFLLKSFADDTWLLANELKKISFSINNEIIDLESVKKISLEIYSEDIFSLIDVISIKNHAKSLELLEKQYLAGLSSEFILTMLIRQFKILIQVKDASQNNINEKNIANELKMHPFVVKKAVISNRQFNKDELINILNKLIEIDYKNKSGKSDLNTELLLFISSI